MRIIYNNHFPFGRYWAINICGLVFARKDYGVLGEVQKNHEMIHSLQQREMLYVFFYIWYILEWSFLLFRYRDSHKAYLKIGFEREAYSMENDLDYPKRRKHYDWFKFVKF